MQHVGELLRGAIVQGAAYTSLLVTPQQPCVRARHWKTLYDTVRLYLQLQVTHVDGLLRDYEVHPRVSFYCGLHVHMPLTGKPCRKTPKTLKPSYDTVRHCTAQVTHVDELLRDYEAYPGVSFYRVLHMDMPLTVRFWYPRSHPRTTLCATVRRR